MTREAQLTAKLLRLQQEAADGALEAVKASRKQLKANQIEDPARTGRDLSQIGTQAADKRMTMEGRPTQITANLREIPEIIERLKVLAPGLIVEDPPLIEATAEDDDGGASPHAA